MAFQKKTWVDRLAEFPGRRLLKKISGSDTEMTVDVYRAEGNVSREGDPYNAANMNDFEQRVADEFTRLYSDIALKSTDIEKIMSYLWPDVLPLFQNGKIYAGYSFAAYKFSGTTINAGVGGNVITVGVQGGDGSYSTKVDLTKFSTIKVIGRSQGVTGGAYAASFKVSRNADLSNHIKGVSFTASDAEYGIGVSDLSGEYYVGLYTHSSADFNSCIVSRILLE